jgi:RNA polymerase sigma-70 factor, ECF subfamily
MLANTRRAIDDGVTRGLDREPGVLGSAVPAEDATGSFPEVYDRYFDFVWRVARRLGVGHEALDDIVQETFLVVHRRLAEARSGELRPWIYGITVHTVRNHRRSLRRKSPHARGDGAPDPDALADIESDGPERRAEKAEAARALYAILDDLDDDKREVFVLVELEQLSVTDVADVLGMKLNTVYSRLRLARAEFEEGVARHRARDAWRSK